MKPIHYVILAMTAYFGNWLADKTIDWRFAEPSYTVEDVQAMNALTEAVTSDDWLSQLQRAGRP